MFTLTKSLCAVVILATVHDAVGFTGGASLQLARKSPALSRVRCQLTPNEETAAPIPDSPKSIATGGTDYTKLPKKEITPLFLIPSSSIVGRGDMVGDLGFDPLGLATVSTCIRISVLLCLVLV
jgi:hypothetical protein